MQLLLLLQLHKAVIPVRLARAPRKAESTSVHRYRTAVGSGSFLLSVPRQHAKTGSLLLCRDHPVAATAAFDTPIDAAPAATPVAATITHAAVICRDDHCRGQRHGTRHVVTSAAADAVAPPGTAISVAVTVTRAVVTRHTPL